MAAARRGRGRATSRRLILAPEVETRPWEEQLALDDAPYREQIAYLLERSAFYREAGARLRLGRDGRRPRRHRAAAADREAASCGDRARRTTRSARTCARRRPRSCASTRPAAPPGTPSYIPLTAGDLDNWVTGSARSYAASGIERRPADRLDLQRGPVRRGRRARGVRPHRPRATSRSAPATPSGWCGRSSCCGPRPSC